MICCSQQYISSCRGGHAGGFSENVLRGVIYPELGHNGKVTGLVVESNGACHYSAAFKRAGEGFKLVLIIKLFTAHCKDKVLCEGIDHAESKFALMMFSVNWIL